MGKPANTLISKEIRKRDIKNLIAMLISQIGIQGLCTTLISTYISSFYTDYLYVSIGLISSMLAIGTIIDAVTDLAMGFVIEHFETKYGRIKHWFLWSAIPVAVCTALLFWCQPEWSATVKAVYFFIVYNLYTLALTSIRLQSLSALSLCYSTNKSRESAAWMVGFGGQIGNSISSMLIAPMIAALGGGLIAYRTSGTFFAGIGGLLILLSFFLITEVRGSIAAQRNAAKFDETVEVPPIPVKEEKKKLTLKEMLREASYLVRNEYWVISMIGELFGGMALGFLLGTAVYFCNHVLGNPVAITGIFGTMTIGMLIGLAVTDPLIAFMDGKWICVLGNFIAGCGLVVACVGVFIFNNLPLMYAGITIRQFGSGMFMAINNDMGARCVDYGEWKFGFRQDGLSFSGRSVVGKVTMSLATAIMGLILSLAGYDGSLSVQPDSAIEALKWTFLFIPMILQFVSGILFCFFKLTNKRMTEIQNDLKERHNQQAQ